MRVTPWTTVLVLLVALAMIAGALLFMDVAFADLLRGDIYLSRWHPPRHVTYVQNPLTFVLIFLRLALFAGAMFLCGIALGTGVFSRFATLRGQFFTGDYTPHSAVVALAWIGAAFMIMSGLVAIGVLICALMVS